MQSFRMRTAILSALLSLTLTPTAFADDGFSYHLSGFGTVGYVQTNTDDIVFRNPGQERGATKSGSLLVDSRLAGQLDVNFNDQFSATVQGLAQQNERGVFKPTLEWAFLRYKPFDGVSVRLGRLGWPVYLVSDYRYVGYANPWLRAPIEIYNLVPLDYYDGADVTWRHTLGSGTVSLQAFAGNVEKAVPGDQRINVHSLYGSYITYDIGDFHLRGGLSRANMNLYSNGLTGLFEGLNAAGFGNITQSLDPPRITATFASLGGTYDANRIYVSGEYAKGHGSGFLLHSTGWYGTFGYRFGSWLPYVTYAGYNKPGAANQYAIPSAGPLLGLSEGLSALTQHTYQHTTSLGVRWDVHKDIDIKAQFDHVLPSSNGGDFTGATPVQVGHSVNVYSAVVDFVF
jgi:hypothetical protein